MGICTRSCIARQPLHLVRKAVNLPRTSHGPAARPQWEIPVQRGRELVFVPDHVEVLE